MDLGYAGSCALVTGGSKGMGRAIAETLAAEGTRVAVLARGQDALDDTVAALLAGGSPDALGISTDMGDAGAISAALRAIGDRWGQLNVVVNTIGPYAGAFEELSDDDWFEAFNLGTMSAVRTIRAALPLLRAAEWARIVNLSAHSTRRQGPRLVNYTAAKAALTSVSKNLAKSLAAEGILVNTVSPGTFLTHTFKTSLRPFIERAGLDVEDPRDVMTWIADTYGHPCDLGRAGLPEEIASAVVYLASRRNTYCTGADLNVDGGSDFV
jgi:NAD(P)-dependent dehydrogenase (short-subunit alcohol dehydrogenase family)